MADILRFDDRVVVVTGAGNGLGRTYALMLGARGAKVVVNDLGGSSTGDGADKRAADVVVEQIIANGGEAVADYNSVVDGHLVIETAMKKWGRVDVVINNAGILRDGSFQKMKESDWELVYQVHLLGSMRVTRAAWNVMRDQGYGRVIFVTSAAGIYGNFGQANYSAMKLGIVGLANVLALEGKKRGIYVNTIAPIAASRLTATVMPEDLLAALKPEYVAPVVAYLAHESCDDTGGLYELGAGWVGRLRFERTYGSFIKPSTEGGITPEHIRDRWTAITKFDSKASPALSNQEAMARIMGELASAGDDSEAGADAGAGSGASSLLSAPLFTQMAEAIKAEPSLAKKINAVIVFKVNPGGVWTVDMKTAPYSVTTGEPSKKADLTLTVDDEILASIASGKQNAQQAFMSGKLKAKGNMGIAMKLGTVLKAGAARAKL